MTIKDAVIKVLTDENRPLSVDEIYTSIDRLKLFTFNTKTPLAVLKATVRKNCLGGNQKINKPVFEKIGEKYRLISS